MAVSSAQWSRQDLVPSQLRLSLNFQCNDLQLHDLPGGRLSGLFDRVSFEVLTEVVRERIATQESNEAVELPYSILKRRPGKAPSIISLELERRLCCVRRSLLDIVGFIKLLEKDVVSKTMCGPQETAPTMILCQ